MKNNKKTITLHCGRYCYISYPLLPCGPIPHNHGESFDGPPTLERSGYEHRVGRLHPLSFWKGRGLGSGLRTLPQGRDRWGLLTIHILIILLIIPRSNIIHPVLVFQIPLHGLLYTLFKLQTWFPTKLRL